MIQHLAWTLIFAVATIGASFALAMAREPSALWLWRDVLRIIG